MLYFFSYVVILIVIIKESSEFCPSKCTCDLDFFVSCSNANLDVVPIQLNPTVKYINLTRNNISDINFTFIFYNKLQVLDLSHNQLDDISTNNFEPLESLLVLIMNNNNIKLLKSKAFAGLTELSELDLSTNRISFIHQNAFANLLKLVWLDLSFNKINQIESNFFKHLKRLEWLCLRSNLIMSFAFSENHQHSLFLRHIDLSMNLVEYVNVSDITSLQMLSWLNVSNNLLSDQTLASFYKFPNLKVLDLSNNFFNVSIQIFLMVERRYLA